MDVLHPLSAGLIRGIHIDGRHQFTESIRGEFFNMNVLVRFLDELLNILDLLFLYFDFLLDGILQQKLEEISYKALPAALVDRVEIDVESMKIGDAVLVKDLAIASNPDIDLMTDPEAVVVTVTRAHNAPEEETEETDADAAADTKKDAAKKEEK